MKVLFTLLVLSFSFAVSANCVSDYRLKQEAKRVEALASLLNSVSMQVSTSGLASNCRRLERAVEMKLCTSVTSETLYFAQDVLENDCSDYLR